MTHLGKRGLKMQQTRKALPNLLLSHCLHLPLHPFLSHLGDGHCAGCPPCHPSQETMALLHPAAVPLSCLPQEGFLQEGHCGCQIQAGLAATLTGRTYLLLALPCTRADLAQRLSVFSLQDPPPGSTCLPSKATRGSWKMRMSGAGGI